MLKNHSKSAIVLKVTKLHLNYRFTKNTLARILHHEHFKKLTKFE